MTSNSSRLSWLLFSVLAGVIVVDSALFAYVRWSSETSGRDVDVLTRSLYDSSPEYPSGYDAAGHETVSVPKQRRGYVIRYAAKNCQFCKQDQDRWIALSSKLAEAGFDAVVIVPSVNDEYPAAETLGRVSRASFVNVGWLKEFRLISTPTMIIVDANQRPVWYHIGMLSQKDVAVALRTVSAH